MKIEFRTLGLGLALLATLSAPLAAKPSPTAAPSTAPRQAGKPHADRAAAVMQRLQRDLGLSDEQMTKLQPILKAYHEQTKERMKAARQELESVLTPEQKAQLEQIHQQRMQARREKGTAAKPPADGKRPPSPMSQINLTDEQKAKLKAFREKGMEQRKADQQALFAQTRTVLTPDQETKLEQQMTHRGHKPAPRKGDAPASPAPH